MARVFLGRDNILDRPVAVKILRFGYGGSDIGARFSREGRTAARLSHPNIVQVYDAGEDEFEGHEASYIVMEYLPGGDLKDLVDEHGPMPPDRLAKLGTEVAAGLAHAHERGVIHRDIKPHNILLDDLGRPKLTDFGIARALDATHATRTGSFLGTALYASPEQLQGETVTPKSDVYSLGATLFQAATGEPPFSGTPISVASQHVSKTPPSPRELNAAIGGDMENLILACLSKDPDDRPTADELRSRLAGLETETDGTKVYAAPVTQPAQRTQDEPTHAVSSGTRDQSRTRVLLAVLALLLILAAIAAIALPKILGQGDQGNQPVPRHEAGKPNKPSGGQDKSNQPSAATTPASEPTAQTTQPSQEPTEQTTKPSQKTNGLTAEAASQTVRSFYTDAADGDYSEASSLLSESYRRSTFPDEATFEGTFRTLERIEFTDGPTAQVNGNTATVSFSDIAHHTDHTERRSGTATLINEGGEWKIDSINV